MDNSQSHLHQGQSRGNGPKILAVAKALFRQRGFPSVSVNDIVVACGISKPTLYHYYGDKETLFTEVLIEMMRNGHHYLVEGIRGCQSVREKLYRLTEGFMTNSPTSMTTMMHDASENLSEISLKKVKDAYRYYMVSSFEAIFQEGIESGEIKNLDLTDLSLLYVSMLDAYTLNRTTLSGRPFDYRGISQFLVSALMDGVANNGKEAGNAL